MDCLIGVIAQNLVLACVDALEDWVVEWITHRNYEIIPVTYKEAMQLGCNIVSLGGDRVISDANNKRINEKMKSLGIKVYAPDLSMFTLGGGGVHCLSQSLRRELSSS